MGKLAEWLSGKNQSEHPDVKKFSKEATKAMELCVCEHARQLHTHHRSGTDCSKCSCRKYLKDTGQSR